MHFWIAESWQCALQLGIAIPGSQIPGSRTVFQSRNPGIMKDQIPGFRDYKITYYRYYCVWNACINHEIKQCKTIIRFWNRQGIMKPGPGGRFRLGLHITIQHIHTGERLFSYSVCDYQCRWDCDLKRHICVVAPVGSSRFHNFYVSQLYRAYSWYCLLELGSLVTSHVYKVFWSVGYREVTFDLAWLWKVRGRFALARSTPYLQCTSWVVVVVVYYTVRFTNYNTSAALKLTKIHIARSYTLVVQT